ncbi:T9SS type A sorting domain-containing protein [candidate division KSB1 bacterium]|nr:T9SS type A sorting domain-containing protein [candidate division KSB1 bacterium]
MHIEGGMICTIDNSLFYENYLETGGGGGGAVCNVNSTTSIINCTFYKNTAVLRAGAVLNYSTTADAPAFAAIVNSILWQNSASFDRDVCDYAPSTGTATSDLRYCCIRIEPLQNGNINSEPDFLDPGLGNFQLSENSPCIDAGSPDTSSLNLPETDLAGNRRITDGDQDSQAVIDIGVYEFKLNQHPLISGISDFSFVSGESYIINLDTCVIDDDSPHRMNWSVHSTATALLISVENQIVTFQAPGWTGSADVYFSVTDPYGASDSTRISVLVTSASAVEAPNLLLPESIQLFQNYPNPFNARTIIAFEVPESTEISVGIFNMKGELVAELMRERECMGMNSVAWDAGNCPSGSYFIRLAAGAHIVTKKCLLLK